MQVFHNLILAVRTSFGNINAIVIAKSVVSKRN